jgi:four helix bundle protein
MNTHHNLNVWKLSIRLVTDIYVATKIFPVDEKYGLTSQIRRCAVSVPSNIAEGAARKNSTEYAHFLRISLGSLSELETQLIISNHLGYIDQVVLSRLLDDRTIVAKQLQSLYNKIASKSQQL